MKALLDDPELTIERIILRQSEPGQVLAATSWAEPDGTGAAAWVDALSTDVLGASRSPADRPMASTVLKALAHAVVRADVTPLLLLVPARTPFLRPGIFAPMRPRGGTFDHRIAPDFAPAGLLVDAGIPEEELLATVRASRPLAWDAGRLPARPDPMLMPPHAHALLVRKNYHRRYVTFHGCRYEGTCLSSLKGKKVVALVPWEWQEARFTFRGRELPQRLWVLGPKGRLIGTCAALDPAGAPVMLQSAALPPVLAFPGLPAGFGPVPPPKSA